MILDMHAWTEDGIGLLALDVTRTVRAIPTPDGFAVLRQLNGKVFCSHASHPGIHRIGPGMILRVYLSADGRPDEEPRDYTVVDRAGPWIELVA